MAMRVSGINSGLDTDAIVQELVSAYSKKTEKYEKEQTKLSWKQDIWKSLNSKVYSLYTKISNMRFSSAYAIKTVNSSDTSKATVSASGNAVNGTHKLNVLKTAQSAYMTSGKVTGTGGAKVTTETTLKELGFSADLGLDEEANLRVKTKDENGNWVNKDIKFKSDSTVEDVLKQLQDAGLNASFDENHGRFYLSSKVSGSNGDFDIEVANTVWVPKEDGNGGFVRDEDGNVIYEEKDASEKGKAASDRLLGILGFKTDMKVQEGTTIRTKQNNSIANVKTPVSNLITLANGETLPTELEFDVSGKKVKIENFGADTRIEDIIKQFQEQGVNASYDGVAGKLVFQGKDEITFSASGSDINSLNVSQKMLTALGLSDITELENNNAVKINGQDSEIILDGTRYTNSTNEFSINGLNITAQGVTGDGADNAITITTNTDTQGLYDTVKNFLTEYNNIINEITKLYNADSSRGYDPLTDEEKDAMSDTEISKWETKIKDSLLRRDNSLNSIMSAMINSMNTGITIGDKTYSLTSFGIHTLGFLNAVENEQNAFHIDGDEEDENTAGNKDYLMDAIKNDPDTVIEFMKQLSTNLYNAIDKQMQGNSLRSKYKIYNDKELDTQYQNYTKTIKDWEKKVSAKEDYYYKKFSAMETALAKLNSQQSSLAGLLGN